MEDYFALAHRPAGGGLKLCSGKALRALVDTAPKHLPIVVHRCSKWVLVLCSRRLISTTLCDFGPAHIGSSLAQSGSALRIPSQSFSGGSHLRGVRTFQLRSSREFALA